MLSDKWNVTFALETVRVNLITKFYLQTNADDEISALLDMLQLSPAETIIFQKNSSSELTGNVHILNTSKKAVTYKVRWSIKTSIWICNNYHFHFVQFLKSLKLPHNNK